MIVRFLFVILLPLHLFGQNPGNVSTDIKLWLKANQGVVGATPITSWLDQSGNFSNPTINGNPNLIPVNYNYNPTISLDGLGDFFSWTGLTTGYLQGEIFSVHNIPSLTPSEPPSELWDFQDNNGSSHPYSDNIFYDEFGSTRFRGGVLKISNAFTNTVDVSKQYLYNTNIDTTSSTNYIQGILRAQGQGTGTGSFTKNIVRIGTGDFLTDNSNDFMGNMGEIILYNRKLSIIERRKIWTYLAIKYGITLENTGGGVNGDYISTNSNTIWDASVNVGYHNDVIGIGRDDNEALLQNQSHTMDDTTRIYIDALQVGNTSNLGTFTNNLSYVLIGHNKGDIIPTTQSNNEIPSGLFLSRIEREWKVTKSNFAQNFSCDFTIGNTFAINNTTCFQLLVDDDGNFTNATVYNQNNGLSFSYTSGILTVSNISNIHIPNDNTAYITIAIIKPTINLGNDTTLCQGETLTLDATTPNATYLWQDNSTEPTFNVSQPRTYSVEITVNNCSATDTVLVNYNSLPIIDLGNDTSLCQNETLTLDATTPNATYLWQDNSTEPTFNVSQPRTYSVEITVNNCSATDKVLVNYNPLPIINLGNDTSLCQGEILTLDATTPNATYLWQDNSTEPTFNVSQLGTYSVKVTVNNCSATDTVLVNYKSLPIINLGNDTSLCQGETLTLDATTPNATYLWQDNSTYPTFNVSQPGTYSVKVNVNDCNALGAILINKKSCEIILEIPNVFTPNNDGVNDLLVPIINKGIVSMNTIIYNRSGSKIYETNNLLINWNGQNVNEGTYFWVVYYTDINGVKDNLKGYVTLLK